MEKTTESRLNSSWISFNKGLLLLFFLALYTSSLEAQCDFNVKLQVTELSIEADLYNFNTQTPSTLESAYWYIQTTGQVLGNDATLNYTFSDYGECTLCVVFEATKENGTSCNAAICQALVLEASSSICIDATLITEGEPCSAGLDPVCACNGTSYVNACEAEYWAGASSFSLGTCQVDCSIADCMLPGDANKDLKADLFDVLNLGMAFGRKGPQRPQATNDFTTQAAPDWLQTSKNGINYKHFDGNGDGVINRADLEPIVDNYTPMYMPEEDLQTEEGPLLYIVFSTDTIEIDGDTPDQIEVNANIMLGESNLPIEDFYGMALYLSYPSDLASHVGMDYSNGSFAGSDNEVMWYRKDMQNYAQLDLALTRMNGVPKSGFGRIAALNFIVESDIIDGRSERYVSFPISVAGLKVVNRFGEEIKTRISEIPASLTFSVLTTGTFEPNLGAKIDAYPNPVTSILNVDLGELKGESFKLYNTLGQLVLKQNITAQQEKLDIAKLERGVYMLNIYTDQGIANKRIIIEK